jgi:hypothetical protein
MGNLQRRIQRVEQEYGIGKNDGPVVEIPVGSSTLRMTERQLTGLLQWVQERNGVSGDACHELTGATC